ncbi:MAG: acyl carrier protein [Treponema sp.]|nr:acyl carrier protein [Treponema sp.]
MDNNEIFETFKELLISEFEIDPGKITLEKHLENDLDLDSLDMVDAIVSLKGHIGDKVNPGLFKDARTVQDVVNLLKPLWK